MPPGGSGEEHALEGTLLPRGVPATGSCALGTPSGLSPSSACTLGVVLRVALRCPLHRGFPPMVALWCPPCFGGFFGTPWGPQSSDCALGVPSRMALGCSHSNGDSSQGGFGVALHWGFPLG